MTVLCLAALYMGFFFGFTAFIFFRNQVSSIVKFNMPHFSIKSLSSKSNYFNYWRVVLKKIFALISRAWPALAIIIIIALHLSILKILPTQSNFINKLAGTFMQVVGGLIVLCAVNQNLVLFRSQSLSSVVMSYFRDVPLERKPITARVDAAGHMIYTGTASVSVTIPGETLEERVIEAERQIKEVRNLVNGSVGELNSKIDEFRSELSSSITLNQKTLLTLAENVEQATVGGFKEQTFGVMLVIYGALVGIFT